MLWVGQLILGVPCGNQHESTAALRLNEDPPSHEVQFFFFLYKIELLLQGAHLSISRLLR